jgi:hypothetical protein
MKTYGGVDFLGPGQLHAPTALPPGKDPSVPIGYEAGWTPGPVWTTWRRENS